MTVSDDLEKIRRRRAEAERALADSAARADLASARYEEAMAELERGWGAKTVEEARAILAAEESKLADNVRQLDKLLREVGIL